MGKTICPITKDHQTLIQRFGHNLHLAVNKAVTRGVSAALLRLCKTPSRDHQSSHANLPKNRLLTPRTTELDKPTCRNSSHDIAERFLKQQQTVHAVQIEDQKK